MNFKQIVSISIFSFISMLLLNYFFPPKNVQNTAEELVKKGTFIKLAENAHLLENINTSLHFASQEKENNIIEFEKNGYKFIFDSFYASLTSVIYHNPFSKEELVLFSGKHQFATSLKNEMMSGFVLEEKSEKEDKIILVFKLQNDNYTIIKEFLYDLSTSVITLKITGDIKEQDSVRVILEQINNQKEDLFYFDASNKLLKTENLKSVNVYPNIVGYENNNGIIALIENKDEIIERAYKGSQETNQILFLETSKKTDLNISLNFYAGLKEYYTLKNVKPALVDLLEYGWLGKLSAFFVYLLNKLVESVHNYGIAIIIFALFLRLIIFAFSFFTRDSQKKSDEFKKRLKYIQLRHKNEPDIKRQKEQELFSEYGAMPGFLSYIPQIIQFISFFALQKGLKTSPFLYKASFLWISDLSQVDPYGVFSFLLAISVYLHTPQETPIKQKLLILVLSSVVAICTWYMAAGLVIFIAISSWLSMVQNRYVLGKVIS